MCIEYAKKAYDSALLGAILQLVVSILGIAEVYLSGQVISFAVSSSTTESRMLVELAKFVYYYLMMPALILSVIFTGYGWYVGYRGGVWDFWGRPISRLNVCREATSLFHGASMAGAVGLTIIALANLSLAFSVTAAADGLSAQTLLTFLSQVLTSFSWAFMLLSAGLVFVSGSFTALLVGRLFIGGVQLVSVAYLELPSGSLLEIYGSRVFGRGDLNLPPHITSFISERHFKIFYREGIWYVEDLGSQYGTLVNGVQIKGAGPVALSEGAIISPAGVVALRFTTHK